MHALRYSDYAKNRQNETILRRNLEIAFNILSSRRQPIGRGERHVAYFFILFLRGKVFLGDPYCGLSNVFLPRFFHWEVMLSFTVQWLPVVSYFCSVRN